MAFKRVVWSPVEEEWLQKNKGKPVNQLCVALAKSRHAIKKKLAELSGKKVKTTKASGKKSNIGKRADLGGQFFRSSWESNLMRLLLKQPDIKLVEYEPTDFTFWQFGHKKGTVSYTPDFKITYQNGDYRWIEVKGYLKPTDKTKIRRFKKYYPQEADKLLAVVGGPTSKSAEFFREQNVEILWYYTQLNKKYRNIIAHWE